MCVGEGKGKSAGSYVYPMDRRGLKHTEANHPSSVLEEKDPALMRNGDLTSEWGRRVKWQELKARNIRK